MVIFAPDGLTNGVLAGLFDKRKFETRIFIIGELELKKVLTTKVFKLACKEMGLAS